MHACIHYTRTYTTYTYTYTHIHIHTVPASNQFSPLHTLLHPRCTCTTTPDQTQHARNNTRNHSCNNTVQRHRLRNPNGEYPAAFTNASRSHEFVVPEHVQARSVYARGKRIRGPGAGCRDGGNRDPRAITVDPAASCRCK